MKAYGSENILVIDCFLQILAMDINRENYELGLPVIQKAGVAHKIDFKEGPALPVLDQLIQDVSTPSFEHLSSTINYYVLKKLCS